jgi:hypothetical protein
VHLQHGWSLVAWANVDLYEGKADDAYARVHRQLPALERSFVMRFERLRAELLWLRARAALALATAVVGGRTRLLAEAKRCGKRLLAESAPWAPAAGYLVLAGAFGVHGREAEAREPLQIAGRLARATDFHLIDQLSAHLAGDTRPLAGVVARPDRWLRMLAPGLAPRST